MASDYCVQILHIPTNTVVAQWRPREAEPSLAVGITNILKDKGVGVVVKSREKFLGLRWPLFGTTKHVVADVHDAVAEFLLELKKKV